MDPLTVSSYMDARELIQDGDIVFITDRSSPVAWLVRFFTRSRYSHVGIAFWMQTGGISRLMMAEAQGGTNRRIVNLSKYAQYNLDVIKAPGPWKRILGNALARLSDVPYGYMEAFYVGLVETALKYFDIELPRKDFNGEICSEYVAKMYNLPKKHISPQVLIEHLKELGHDVRVLVRKQA